MKWWEKTVEYLFVSIYFDNDLMLAPLDGNEERLGDTILSKDNKWIVIEFKRNETCIDAEKSKFTSYEEAKDELGEEDSHHLLIYGKFEGRLILECKTYFSNQHKDIGDALLSGLGIDSFIEYIKRFINFKKPPKDGGGGLSFEDYTLVACVNSEGRLVSCMSLSEHISMFGGKGKQVHDKVMKAGN